MWIVLGESFVILTVPFSSRQSHVQMIPKCVGLIFGNVTTVCGCVKWRKEEVRERERRHPYQAYAIRVKRDPPQGCSNSVAIVQLLMSYLWLNFLCYTGLSFTPGIHMFVFKSESI